VARASVTGRSGGKRRRSESTCTEAVAPGDEVGHERVGVLDELGELGQAPLPVALPDAAAEVLCIRLAALPVQPADAEPAVDVDPGVTVAWAEADAGQDAARDRLADGLGGDRRDHRQQRPSRFGVGLEAKLNVVAGMLHGSVGVYPRVE
jgi:hypothetical protein